VTGKPRRRAPQVGTGGHNRRRLEGRGPTPPAEQRPGHPAARRAAAAAKRPERRPAGGPRRGPAAGQTEVVAGRNPVVEALRARVPATALHVATGVEADPRLREALRLAAEQGVAILETGRPELDRLAVAHQGLVLTVPPYAYHHPDDLLARAVDAAEPALIVACDGVTDPRNLGAIARSVAAFGGHGVLVPERRAAGVTAAAWKASAGSLARLPVARATNLVRSLRSYAEQGLVVVGLTGAGALDIADLSVGLDPIVVVVGAEGRGLSRLVADTCDLTARIDVARGVESLNASVAAGIVLHAIAERRRSAAI